MPPNAVRPAISIADLTDAERAHLDLILSDATTPEEQARQRGYFLRCADQWRLIDEHAPEGSGTEFFTWLGEVTEAVWHGLAPSWLDGGRGDTSWSEPREIRWLEPLREHEIAAMEARLGFALPPDYRAFLATLHTTTPTSEHPNQRPLPLFTDWRATEMEDCAPYHLGGILFDVWVSGWWHAPWGPMPQTLPEAEHALRVLLRDAAPLIATGVRYLVAAPARSGNPVLSINQSDTIVWGASFRETVLQELLGIDYRVRGVSTDVVSIPFWGDLLSWHGYGPKPLGPFQMLYQGAELSARDEEFERWSERQDEMETARSR